MLWKRLFDAVDERVSPAVDEFARSDELMTLTAVAERGRDFVARRFERTSRRALHLLNLPAGSDVNRLLDHIARLEREVAALRARLEDRELEQFLEELAEEGE